MRAEASRGSAGSVLRPNNHMHCRPVRVSIIRRSQKKRTPNTGDEGREIPAATGLVTKLQGDFGLGRGEAEAIVLALAEKAQVLGIDDKNGINACKLLGIAFTTAIGILVRSREKGLLTGGEARAKLTTLAKFGRYKESILEDARGKLEARP